LYRRHTTHDFPEDPFKQLKMATEAVFKSWNGKRAVDYRNAAGIAHDLGTAVNIVTMVFGNMGDDCATGVAMTRNGSTGENHIEGDYLTNAQGEDVVAGIRMTRDLSLLPRRCPRYAEFERIAQLLEKHYREMQDMEFTIEKGKLWMLQTRDGKRTAQAAVRIAVEMAEDGLIDQQTAVLRVKPGTGGLFPASPIRRPRPPPGAGFWPGASTSRRVRPSAGGLRCRHGRGLGQKRGQSGDHGPPGDQARRRPRHAGRPGDSHQPRRTHQPCGPGGPTVRQTGGGGGLGITIDLANRLMTIGSQTIHEGDWISIDGTTGGSMKASWRPWYRTSKIPG
jgi:pyruvate,orthophosphate dikinase